MSDSPLVLLDVTPQGVATVTLNRPELHNAFNDEVIELLAEMFDDLGKQDGIRAVVIEGAGKSFSAGGDLNWMRRAADYSAEQNEADARALGTMFQTLREMPKPTIALVHGGAYAGGVGLLAACDIAVAERGTSFALTEVKLGLIPAVISPHVIAAIGERNARRYILTAERFDAEAAFRMGLVHEVVDGRDGLAAARDRLLGHLMAAAPGAIAASKELIRAVAWRDIDDEVIADTAARIAERRAGSEGREGVSAFLDKRKPSWTERG